MVDYQATPVRHRRVSPGFERRISDLLLDRTLPPSSGLGSERFNGGLMRVRGFESSINVIPPQFAGVQWSSRVNFALNRAKIMELRVPAFLFSTAQVGAVRIEKGKSPTQLIGNDTVSVAGKTPDGRDSVGLRVGQVVPVVMGDEELILIRAEARWFTGNKQGAVDDINFIRVNSGGLGNAAITAASTDDQFITELLYNRRYSLFFEYGHRWWDARRFNRLTTLDKALPTHRIFPFVPYSADECLARNPAPANACTQVTGV